MSNMPLINMFKKEKLEEDIQANKTIKNNNDDIDIMGCGINKYKIKKDKEGNVFLEKIKFF